MGDPNRQHNAPAGLLCTGGGTLRGNGCGCACHQRTSPIYSAPGVVDTSGRYAEGEHFYFDRKEISYMGNGVEAAYFSLGLDCWVMRMGGELHDAHDMDTTLLPAARRNHGRRCTGIWSGTSPAASVAGCYRFCQTLEAELLSRRDLASAVQYDLHTLREAAAAAAATVVAANNGLQVASRERVRLEAVASDLSAAVTAAERAEREETLEFERLNAEMCNKLYAGAGNAPGLHWGGVAWAQSS